MHRVASEQLDSPTQTSRRTLKESPLLVCFVLSLQAVFSLEDEDRGETSLTEMSINTGEEDTSGQT